MCAEVGMVARLAETLQKQAMDSYNMEQASPTCQIIKHSEAPACNSSNPSVVFRCGSLDKPRPRSSQHGKREKACASSTDPA